MTKAAQTQEAILMIENRIERMRTAESMQMLEYLDNVAFGMIRLATTTKIIDAAERDRLKDMKVMAYIDRETELKGRNSGMKLNGKTLKDTLDFLQVEKVKDQIKGYFGYYAGLFETIKGDKGIIIIIPMKEGSKSLDRYFINILLENGYTFHEYFLLGEIYLIKKTA